MSLKCAIGTVKNTTASGRSRSTSRSRWRLQRGVTTRQIVETIGVPGVFPQPGGDIALSPDSQWFVNGHSLAGNNGYTIFRFADGTWARTPEMSRGRFTTGELRIDGSPAWNRSSDAFLFPGLDPKDGTRQIFVARISGARRVP